MSSDQNSLPGTVWFETLQRCACAARNAPRLLTHNAALPLHPRICVYSPHLSTFTASRRTLTSADLPLYLHTPTHLHMYVTPAHPHCHSFTSALSFSFSTYLFSSYCKSDFFATSYSITDCIKKSWLLDNSILIVSLFGMA